MEVEVPVLGQVGLAKPLAPDNGFVTLGGMFDDIIFPSVGKADEPSPLPAPASAEPVLHTIAQLSAAAAYPRLPSPLTEQMAPPRFLWVPFP